MKEKHNRKAFSRTDKEVVDQRFRPQAAQQFKLESDKLKRAMTEVTIFLCIVHPH